MRATLDILGAVFTLAGIVLAAAPDLVPGVPRASRWANVRFRGWRRRPPEGTVYADAGTGTLTLSGAGARPWSDFPDAQGAFEALSQRVDALDKQLVELRAALKAEVARQLADAQEVFRWARIFGTALLVAGLALTTWATFVT